MTMMKSNLTTKVVAVVMGRRNMSSTAKVWVDKNTRVICQGFTGKQVKDIQDGCCCCCCFCLASASSCGSFYCCGSFRHVGGFHYVFFFNLTGCFCLSLSLFLGRTMICDVLVSICLSTYIENIRIGNIPFDTSHGLWNTNGGWCNTQEGWDDTSWIARF